MLHTCLLSAAPNGADLSILFFFNRILDSAALNALGIGAASFFREDEGEAEKDRAESPTAIAGTPPKKRQQSTDYRQQTFFKVAV